MNIQQNILPRQTVAPTVSNPLADFLASTHAALVHEEGGAVADYIPELQKADPRHFGIALATMDGHLQSLRICARA